MAPAYVVRTLIMREMGWSWREYQETPLSVLREVKRTLRAESQALRHQSGG